MVGVFNNIFYLLFPWFIVIHKCIYLDTYIYDY